MDLLHIYIGQKLGLYARMASAGALTPSDLASGSGMHQRYAREWLELQAVTGILVVEDIAAPPDQRRFRLPAGHAEAVIDEESMNYLAPVAAMLVSVAQRMPELLAVYGTGEGLDWAAYGPEMWQGQAALNRRLYVNVLGQDYLTSIPELDAILSRPNARVADLGCGGGWSSIAIACAYPGARVDDYDLDAPSIEQATNAADSADLSTRVQFLALDAATLSEAKATYDLVTIFEALHDVPDPIGVLLSALKMLREGGVVLGMDERVADEFTVPGDDVERFMYGWSLPVCLPAGMSEQPSAATGTVMRRSTFLPGQALSAPPRGWNTLRDSTHFVSVRDWQSAETRSTWQTRTEYRRAIRTPKSLLW